MDNLKNINLNESLSKIISFKDKRFLEVHIYFLLYLDFVFFLMPPKKTLELCDVSFYVRKFKSISSTIIQLYYVSKMDIRNIFKNIFWIIFINIVYNNILKIDLLKLKIVIFHTSIIIIIKLRKIVMDKVIVLIVKIWETMKENGYSKYYIGLLDKRYFACSNVL